MSKNKLTKAYSTLLGKVHKAIQSGEKISVKYWDKIHQVLVDAEQINAEESKIVVEALQRDMGEARFVLKDLGKAIGDWLKYDAALIEQNLETWLQLVADDTLVDWIHLQHQWEVSHHYQSGDLVGIGEFSCTQCGQLLRFCKPDYLPTCSHCQSSDFQREAQH